ncbi:MAG: DUF1643 domain-containing protein [Flavobacteriaceae bacterium]|nr:DUF1643 domain-containing protein [Flavobacteriaceae bacterium]
MEKGAIRIKAKRYRLWRIWAEDRPLVLFLLLNPSRGDAIQNDPTVNRLIDFAETHGYGGFYLGNLYAHITPYPKELSELNLNLEKKNKQHIKNMIALCEDVVFAWGNHGELPQWLAELVQKPLCFGQNKNGSPKHPLYLAKSTRLIPFFPQTDLGR